MNALKELKDGQDGLKNGLGNLEDKHKLMANQLENHTKNHNNNNNNEKNQ